ncbi:hypothetical protein CFP56_027723 [Quercus suber]|uniref:Uncharacterized protein n=1 Tax=Quercus suber TaxID=58331 RepID=A0AAW0JX98_QUESU
MCALFATKEQRVLFMLLEIVEKRTSVGELFSPLESGPCGFVVKATFFRMGGLKKI